VKYGNQFGISSSTLENFALQVSNGNPNAIGINGEQGLMQLNPTFCGAAPNGNCLDLVSSPVIHTVLSWLMHPLFIQDYNVMTGARLLAAQQ
jgi:hypothetical protein